jgi:hypothetical protein
MVLGVIGISEVEYTFSELGRSMHAPIECLTIRLVAVILTIVM